MFGVFLIKNPLPAAVALPLVFGCFAVILGGIAIYMGFKMKSS